MKETLKKQLYGLIITAVLLVFSVAFVVLLICTGLLTAGVILAVSAMLFFLSASVYLLTREPSHKVRAVIGTLLAVLILAVQIISGYYIASGAAALSHISKPSAEYAEIGVFVRKDDPAKELSDAKDYTFAILGFLDRENTDTALKEISKTLSKTPKTEEFDGLGELMDSLLSSKSTDAVVINKGFLDLLEDIEGHEEDLSKIRELCTIHIEKETAFVEDNEVSKLNDSVFTVYFSGIDTTGKITKRSRSDVNILATVNVETGQILLVSTPRDYYVPLSNSKGSLDKLTHAGIYGINVSMETLEMLYDTEIDYYFKVNFDGFKDIIDALGGITVHSDYNFKVGLAYVYKKGDNFLDGQSALHFARARKPVPGGDRQRGKHQMEVIKGVINKMCSPAILTGYTETLDGIKGSFETSIPYEEIAKLVRNQINKSTKWNVTSYSVSGAGASRKCYSLGLKAYVMIPDQETVDKAKSLMKQVVDGEVPTP